MIKIRTVVLGVNYESADKEFDEALYNVFGSYFPDNEAVSYFSTLKEATSTISKAFTDSDIVMFLMAQDSYGEEKRMLCKAMGLKFETDAVIKDAAVRSADGNMFTNENFENAHCRLPKNAHSFVLQDGLYAGFALAKGAQTIVVLPYGSIRTSLLIEKQVVPYLKEQYGINIDASAIMSRGRNELDEAIGDSGLKIAVAGTNTAALFKEYTGAVERLSNSVLLSGHTEERKDIAPNDYVVSLSITAAELMHTPYGIAISNAFYSGETADSEKTVYMAVTNDNSTVVREVYSKPYEEVSDFLTRCCSEMCLLLKEIIENDVDTDNKGGVVRKKRGLGGLWASVILSAVLLVGVVFYGTTVFHDNNYSFKKWYNRHLTKYTNYTFEVDDSEAETEVVSDDETEASTKAE